MARRRPFLRFFAAVLLGAALPALAYGSLGVALDPYLVFWKRKAVEFGGMVPEQTRFNKTDLLARQAERYDGVIFGNSRGMMTAIGEINRLVGRQVFNYATSASYPIGYLAKTRWTLKHAPNINDFYFVVWIDQFQAADDQWSVPMLREHYQVSGENVLSYFLFFANLSTYDMRKAVHHHLARLLGLPRDQRLVLDQGVEREFGDLTTQDWFEQPDDAAARARWVAANAGKPPGTFAARAQPIPPEHFPAMGVGFGAPLNPAQLAALAEAADLLRQRHKRVTCVVPPMAVKIQRLVPRERYDEWFRALAAACGRVIDFGFPSTITRDDFYFYDWSHALRQTYSFAWARVFGAAGRVDDPDFGVEVMPGEVEPHLVRFHARLVEDLDDTGRDPR